MLYSIRRRSDPRTAQLKPLWGRIALGTVAAMIFLYCDAGVSRGQDAALAETNPLATQRATLESQLRTERDRGKAAEDPSIQTLEDDLMQVLLDEEVAKQPNGPSKGPNSYLKTQVFYATNRRPAGVYYSDQISTNNSIELGVARLTIGTSYGVRMDYIPNTQFAPRASAKSSPVLSRIDGYEKFRTAIQSESPSQKSPRKILLFVHGFDTSFDEALERTALIATELQSPVVPITYSWPSAGTVPGYSHDEEVVRASTEAFSIFLKEIVSGPAEVVIVCHSMGARLVTSALSDLAKQNFDTKKLSRVVFVAADIFTAEFQSRWPGLSSLKKVRYAFYVSDSDLALKLSFFKHDAPRLGYVDRELWLPPGASTIDASNVDSILNTFGHSYIDNPQLGADIGNWITTGADPIHRGLSSHTITQGTVYYFP